MNPEERRNLLREVALSGNCSHPIRLRGEMVNLETGEVGSGSLRVACKDRRQAVCPACSKLYQADAWILVVAGLIGGKGIPEGVTSHPRLFVTLTAPSFGPVHSLRPDGRCSPAPRSSGHRLCPHGASSRCTQRHAESDPYLGRPLCADCYDYEGAVLWNAHASRLWNTTVQLTRRGLAEAGHIAQARLKEVAKLHYLKVAEMQRRGLVHFHVLLRADGPEDSESDPPDWLSAELLAVVARDAVRRASAWRMDGRTVGWGNVLDIQALGEESRDAERASSYLAKYVTKTTGGSAELAHRFRLRRQIEQLVDDPHARRLALTAWDLGGHEEFSALNLRAHAHTLGFAGQLITKSRRYSTTFTGLRRARAEFMAPRNAGDPVEGTFTYEGRGYDDPRGTQLAELFFAMEKELREEGARARRSPHLIPPERAS